MVWTEPAARVTDMVVCWPDALNVTVWVPGRTLVYDVTNVTNLTRGKKVVIPNVGGSLGISYRLPAVKLSLGYRADVFFNAVDGGVETRKSYSRGFYGPFASVSIGIGG